VRDAHPGGSVAPGADAGHSPKMASGSSALTMY
jgi:hypothetical protein